MLRTFQMPLVYAFLQFHLYAVRYLIHGERSGSVVECLTQDRGAVGLSLTGITALCP